jgi:hypothetical protein
MAQYPIKMLKDESGIPFVPLTTIQAVVGQEYIQSTLMAEEKTTGHFVITNDKLQEDDLNNKIIAVMFEEDITPTTNSYLKLNDGTEYLIYDENGTGPLLIKDFVGVICFLMKKETGWQLVKTGAAAGGSGSGGHTILDGDGNVLPQQSVLQFKGFGVSDNASTGATVISTPALVNNLSTTESGTGPLDAYQGKILNDKFANYALSSSLNNYALKTDLNSYLPLSGGTMTGPMKILGTAASQPLTVRGIVGCTAEGEVSELHLQYQANAPIKLGNDAGYSISADGGQYTGNAATATSATKATKDGDGNTISSTYLKLSGGTITGSVKKAGGSHSWCVIRDSNDAAPVSITSYSGYQPAIKQKAPSGVWGIGCYTSNVHITYFADGTTHNDPTYLLNMSYDGNGISAGGANLPHVWVQSGQPSAKQTGDIWFKT